MGAQGPYFPIIRDSSLVVLMLVLRRFYILSLPKDFKSRFHMGGINIETLIFAHVFVYVVRGLKVLCFDILVAFIVSCIRRAWSLQYGH